MNLPNKGAIVFVIAIVSGTAAAASIGLINSLGTLGGFAGPYMIGSTNGTSGNFARGLYLVGGTLIVSAVTIVLMHRVVHRHSNQTLLTRKVL